MRFGIAILLMFFVYSCAVNTSYAEYVNKDKEEQEMEELFEGLQELQDEYMEEFCKVWPLHPACAKWRQERN